jgi:hypothetical protein
MIANAEPDCPSRCGSGRVGGTLAVSRALGDHQFKQKKGVGADEQQV